MKAETLTVLRSASDRPLRSLLPRGDTLPEELWRRRHRFLLALLLGHVVMLPVLGAARGYGVWHSLAEGGLVPLVLAGLASVPAASRKLRASAVAVGLLSCSALLVHFSGGYIEAHFHFFVMIVILALYEDWLPFLLAVAFVFLHHGVGGAIDPHSVYNHPDAVAHPWRWAAIHATAVSMAGILSVASWRMNEVLRAQKDEALAEVSRQSEQLQARTSELGKANAMLQELDRLKSEFVAVASHDLRTPVAAVTGLAETLDRRWEELDEATRRSLAATLATQGERLRQLSSDLLDLSRLEAGVVEPSPEPIDLGEALGVLAASFPAVSIRVQCPPGLQALADPRHVHRILENYVANAIKYGTPPIEIDASRRGDSIVVRVLDSGGGVPAAFVPRLFEKFARWSPGDSEGSGLGLAIVRGLAQANGGDAWYEPRDAGACFAASLRPAPSPV